MRRGGEACLALVLDHKGGASALTPQAQPPPPLQKNLPMQEGHLQGVNLSLFRFAFAHHWRIGQTDQDTFRAEKTGNYLAPWLLLHRCQELIAFGF